MRGRVCRLQLLVGLSSEVILRSESRGTHNHILLSQIRDFVNLEGSGPRIYIPQEEGGPVIPPGTGLPFRRLLRLARLRWRYSNRSLCRLVQLVSLYSLGADVTENTVSVVSLVYLFSNNYSIVARIFVAVGTCLRSRLSTMAGCLGCCSLSVYVSSRSTFPAFSRRITIWWLVIKESEKIWRENLWCNWRYFEPRTFWVQLRSVTIGVSLLKMINQRWRMHRNWYALRVV
jgi:hypothetical protein